MSTRLSGQFLTVGVPYELGLKEGPEGELLRVVDFDPVRKSWYATVDLDEPYVLAQDGLQPAEGDPRSHQQIVYAVASSVIERFERYLGRRFRWRGDEKLSLVPHAFEGRNAYFDPTRKAVLFGYYRADLKDPGANLPGQMIFTCLSSDIIAHEVTHALVHRLRRHFSVATNADVFAWHEAFADLIALFQHFAYEDVVWMRSHRRRAASNTAPHYSISPRSSGSPLGAARRCAARSIPTSLRECCARPTATTPPPNLTNAARVSSVRCSTPTSIGYRAAVADLLRLATSGAAGLSSGRLHPDLVARVADRGHQDRRPIPGDGGPRIRLPATRRRHLRRRRAGDRHLRPLALPDRPARIAWQPHRSAAPPRNLPDPGDLAHRCRIDLAQTRRAAVSVRRQSACAA